jgi:uncharacterized repeat protein (TIGR03803 family)
MTVRRQTVTTCGTLLTALLFSMSYSTAQTLTTLYTFTGGNDGRSPDAVVIGSGGVLYGTTSYGGTSNYGTVYSLTPPTSPGGAWTETVLYSFAGGSDGEYPNAGVVIGSGGVLYGTTQSGGTGPCSFPGSGCGTVYSLTPPASPGGAWIETVLHQFGANSGDGLNPHQAGLVIGSGGVLYGTTSNGGTGPCNSSYDGPGCGTVYSLTPPTSPSGAWTETVLYSFTGSDGNDPIAGVVIGSGGVLYGVLEYDSVYSLTPPTSPSGAWTETNLNHFGAGGLYDAEYPNAGVVIGSGGVLYGTTLWGGAGM